ncbi:hypothetical protein J1N35_039650, partial [Gossypium stocksii]
MVKLVRRGGRTNRPSSQIGRGRSSTTKNKATVTTNRPTIVNPRRPPTINNQKGQILDYLRDYDKLVGVNECHATVGEDQVAIFDRGRVSFATSSIYYGLVEFLLSGTQAE